MKSSIYKSGIAALVVCALTSTLADARANDSSPRSVAVSIAGIDLDSDEGRRIVFQKLKRAAKTVCSSLSDPHGLTRILLYKKCVDGALTEATGRVKHPAFQEYAYGRIGDRPPEVVTAAR